jgi:hypothetical protein
MMEVGLKVLPERVQDALGQLVGAAKEGLLALLVEVGLGVLGDLLDEEVEQIVEPEGRWNPDRTAVRHGLNIYRLGDRYVALHGGSWFALAGSPLTFPPRADGPGGTAVTSKSTSPGTTAFRIRGACWTAAA